MGALFYRRPRRSLHMAIIHTGGRRLHEISVVILASSSVKPCAYRWALMPAPSLHLHVFN